MTSLLCVIVITHYNIYILPFMEWDQDVPLSTRGTVSITMCVTLGNILQLMYKYCTGEHNYAHLKNSF